MIFNFVFWYFRFRKKSTNLKKKKGYIFQFLKSTDQHIEVRFRAGRHGDGVKRRSVLDNRTGHDRSFSQACNESGKPYKCVLFRDVQPTNAISMNTGYDLNINEIKCEENYKT